MSEGFLERWSRRKQRARAGEGPQEPAPEEPAPGIPAPTSAAPAEMPGTPDTPPTPGLATDAAEPAVPLTLADAQALTIDSDFKPFLAKGVAPEVKNAAFRKLFADPHFNVMDGLDTYVDDYAKPSPLPDDVLRQMASAKFLKLFDEAPEETSGDDGLPGVAQLGDPGELSSLPVADAQPASPTTDDNHTDLRLQPDDAPRAEDARDGTG